MLGRTLGSVIPAAYSGMQAHRKHFGHQKYANLGCSERQLNHTATCAKATSGLIQGIAISMSAYHPIAEMRACTGIIEGARTGRRGGSGACCSYP